MQRNKTNNKGGRKGFGEELKIRERYTALTEPFFEVLKEMLSSEDKTDKKWAVEQLNKAYVKMIPQDITSGGKALNINYDKAFTATSISKGDSGKSKKV